MSSARTEARTIAAAHSTRVIASTCLSKSTSTYTYTTKTTTKTTTASTTTSTSTT